MRLEEILEKHIMVDLDTVQSDRELLEQIQRHLHAAGLYPGGDSIDGLYGPRTKAALVSFCKQENLNNMKTWWFGRSFAGALKKYKVEEAIAEEQADNTPENIEDNGDLAISTENVSDEDDELFQIFLSAEDKDKHGAEKLAFLDKGIEKSQYKGDIDNYPKRLEQKPDGKKVISALKSKDVDAKDSDAFEPYPNVGVIPKIDNKGLDFLHKDVENACVCIGSFLGDELGASWLGRKALDNDQYWSTTKILGILNLIGQANRKYPNSPMENCIVRGNGEAESFSFEDLADDVMTYGQSIGTSNSIAAMFKRFETYYGLEDWTRKMTGNNTLEFRGMYGDSPFFNWPQLFDTRSQHTLVKGAPEIGRGSNNLSAYDLTRVLSMLAWHCYLPKAARLPGCQWHSLQTLVCSMGKDTARYADVAIDQLGLNKAIASPVILSKLGFGISDSRSSIELTYTAFLQFIDTSSKSKKDPSKLRTLAMTLRIAKQLAGDVNAQAREVDARMATAVAQILQRVVSEELV